MKNIAWVALSASLCCSPVGLLAHGHGHSHGHGHDHSHHDHHHHDEDGESAEIIALSDEQIHTAGIVTATARPGHLIRQVRAPGKVTLPQQQLIHIVPAVAGTVQATYKQIGDSVTVGEIVAVLSSRELAEAKAAYAAAEQRASVKQAVYERESDLYRRQLTTDRDYWQAQVEATEARIDRDVKRQHLAAIGLSPAAIDALTQTPAEELRLYELRAPANGVVISQHIARGAYIGIDSDAYLLADLGTRWVEIDLPTHQHHLVHKGATATLTDQQGESCSATIQCSQPQLQEKTRTLRCYATYSGDHGWPTGTFVTATIAADTTRHPLIVPKTAVQKVDGHDVVFVKHSDGFIIRPVTLGPSDEQRIAVTEGLERGEMYAIENTFLLKAEHEKHEAAHEH